MKYVSLTDKEAETIGMMLAADFRLKRCREYKDRFETEGGTFTAIGIARRAMSHLSDGIFAARKAEVVEFVKERIDSMSTPSMLVRKVKLIREWAANNADRCAIGHHDVSSLAGAKKFVEAYLE